MFTKKNAEVEEQIMQDITDEQLSQVTGGGHHHHHHHQVTGGGLNGYTVGVLGTVTSTVTGLASSVSVSGVQVNAAGVSVSTPAISTEGLVYRLL
jgi:hypothetical protein